MTKATREIEHKSRTQRRRGRTFVEEVRLRHIKVTGEIRRAGGPSAFLERVRQELSASR